MGAHLRHRSRIGLFSDIRKNTTSYLLVLPAMVYTFIFGYMTLNEMTML